MDLTIDGAQGFANLTNASDKAWTLNKDLLQGVKVGILGGLFVESNKKSIYKLAVKNVWNHEGKVDFEGRGIKGALGLVKATWGGNKNEKGDRWTVEDVTVDVTNKVWLIAAKGKENVYLMPIVRDLNRCGFLGERMTNSKRELISKTVVNGKGVKEIREWTQIYDNGKKWGETEDEKLRRLMSSGFSITRNVEAAAFTAEESGNKVTVLEESGRLNSEIHKVKEVGYLYKNAGVLNLTDINKNAKSCNEIEHYFPLDLVVLGKIKVEKEGKDESLIEIFDGIREVIGVRLDKVIPKLKNYFPCYLLTL